MNVITSVESLINVHQLFRDKYFPEIEHQFYLLFDEIGSSNTTLRFSFGQFSVLKRDLLIHFQYEEIRVFQHIIQLVKNENMNPSDELIEFFNEHHNAEEEVQVLLQLVQQDLKKYSSYLPYRILLHKLISLQNLVKSHAEEEELFFSTVLPIVLKGENSIRFND